MNNPQRKKLRTDVRWFAERMEEKLEKNVHKGGWEDCDEAYLVRRLLEEMSELVSSILEGKDKHAIIEEAADVANFCMMIADNKNSADIV